MLFTFCNTTPDNVTLYCIIIIDVTITILLTGAVPTGLVGALYIHSGGIQYMIVQGIHCTKWRHNGLSNTLQRMLSLNTPCF